MRKTNKIGRYLPDSLLRQLHHRQTNAGKLAAAWQQICGQDLAKHTVAGSYQDYIFTVFVDNANWASKLRHNLPEITDRCRKLETFSALKKIRIKIKLHGKDTHSTRNTISGKSRISRSAASMILESAKAIEDETLRSSLEKLGGKFKDINNE